jgi:hypothetical protein
MPAAANASSSVFAEDTSETVPTGSEPFISTPAAATDPRAERVEILAGLPEVDGLPALVDWSVRMGV